MGILGSIMNGFKKNVAEMAWPLYEEARKKSTAQLENFLQNEPNYVKKSAVLLALAEKDSYQTEKIYKENNRAYDIQLGNLSSYYRFKPLVDRFFLKYAKKNGGLYKLILIKKTGLVRKFAYSSTSLQKNWKNTRQAFSSPTVRVM